MVYEIPSTMLYLPKSSLASGIPGFYLVWLLLCWFLGIQLETSKQGINFRFSFHFPPSEWTSMFVGVTMGGTHCTFTRRGSYLSIVSLNLLNWCPLEIKGEARLSLWERDDKNFQFLYHCTWVNGTKQGRLIENKNKQKLSLTEMVWKHLSHYSRR